MLIDCKVEVQISFTGKGDIFRRGIAYTSSTWNTRIMGRKELDLIGFLLVVSIHFTEWIQSITPSLITTTPLYNFSFISLFKFWKSMTLSFLFIRFPKKFENWSATAHIKIGYSCPHFAYTTVLHISQYCAYDNIYSSFS